MDDYQYRQSLSIKNCCSVLALPAFDYPQLKPMAARLRATRKELERLELKQLGESSSLGVDGKQVAHMRRMLRDYLQLISDRAVAVLDGMPGIKHEVRMPRANVGQKALLEASARIIRNVQPHLSTLYESGMEEDVIARAENIMKALEVEAAATDRVFINRSVTTRAIPPVIARGRAEIKSLDSTIRLYIKDPQALIHWTKAKRVPKKLGRPTKRRRESLPEPAER